MTEKHRAILGFLAKLSASLLLLVWVFRHTDLTQLREAFGQVRWSLVAWVWAMNIVQFWILSCNMHLILKRQGCDASVPALFATSAVTGLYGLVLPGMLDSSVKWYILKRHTGKGIHVFSGMAYSQVTSMCVTVLTALAALMIAQPTPDIRLSAACAMSMFGVGLLWFLMFQHRTGPRLIAGLRGLLERLPLGLGTIGNRILDQLVLYQQAPWSFHAAIIAINVLGVAVMGNAIYVLAARAAGIDASIGAIIWVCALVYILGRLPISVANFGWRELTLVHGLGLYGVAPSASLVMSMVLFSNKILVAGIGAVFQVFWRFRR